MSYALLCLVFLAVAVAMSIVAAHRRPVGHGAALVATAAALIVLTVVFDGVMIAAGLFAYDDAHLLGLRLGLAPVEDFTYPVAALLLCSAVWNLSARPEHGARPEHAARPDHAARPAHDRREHGDRR